MLGILFTEQGFFRRNSPINAKTIIYDADATISLWMVELIALILEYSRF